MQNLFEMEKWIAQRQDELQAEARRAAAVSGDRSDSILVKATAAILGLMGK